MIRAGDLVRFSRAALVASQRGAEVVVEARRLVVASSHGYDPIDTLRVDVDRSRSIRYPREWVEIDAGYDSPMRVIHDHDEGAT